MTARKSSGFRSLPPIVRVFIYLGGNYFLIFLSQFITGFLPGKDPLVFNLLLCLLLLAFTWVILKLEKWNFRYIGCTAGKGKDWRNLLFGTLAGILMLVVTAWCIKMLTGFNWEFNKNFYWPVLISAFLTTFCSVFAQELSFRGYPFRLLLDHWGPWPAQIVIAILFGFMHLNSDMSPQSMLLTILTTGMGSILFGMTVIRTGRLHMAMGIHFGWNYAQLLLPRAAVQNGEGIWLVRGGSFQPDLAIFIWIVPYMAIMTVAFFLIRKWLVEKYASAKK